MPLIAISIQCLTSNCQEGSPEFKVDTKDFSQYRELIQIPGRPDLNDTSSWATSGALAWLVEHHNNSRNESNYGSGHPNYDVLQNEKIIACIFGRSYNFELTVSRK